GNNFLPTSEMEAGSCPLTWGVQRVCKAGRLAFMQKRLTSIYKNGRPYMMAVVLGTALSTLPSPALANDGANPNGETTLKAIADMNRYCSTCWRNARLPMDSWTDCTQEVFKKLLERVPQNSWDRVLQTEGNERREFLRAIDAVKKRTQRAHKYSGAVDV